MKSYITILVAILFVSCFGLFCFAACPSMDLTGDCVVDFKDFAVFASQWLNEATQVLTWVSISDPGGFTGEMSRYEITNAQYCEFLNDALASGDIQWNSPIVRGRHGVNSGADFIGNLYYATAGSGRTYDGATSGGASRIHYSGGLFTVDSGFEDHPVTYVSWYGATAFCNYYGWRLPTVWEWRAVADYDGTYNYGCGVTINNSIANYLGSTHPNGTTAGGAFGTYGYGLCDMAGNVWEWTSSMQQDAHLFLGGCWDDVSVSCFVMAQGGSTNWDYVNWNLGFRVCR